MYNVGLGGLGQCLNPPCQVGGAIVVNGQTVQLAADVEVEGVGDARILRRVGTGAFYSIYAIPAAFILSGATPSSLYDSWVTRVQTDYAASHPDTIAAAAPAAAAAPTGGLLAGLGSNPLLLAAGAGLVLSLVFRRRGKGRR